MKTEDWHAVGQMSEAERGLRACRTSLHTSLIAEAEAFGVWRMVSSSSQCEKQDGLTGLVASVFGKGMWDGSEA